jgi:hypothetical protein
MAGDLRELKDLPKRVDYFPTIWPGGSVSTVPFSARKSQLNLLNTLYRATT